MRRQEKADRIAAILDRRYPDPVGPLRSREPYQLLVKVVLSAQCTDVRVNQVAPGLFAQASTPAQMTELSEKRIAELIRPCGLSVAKAKSIHGLSQILLQKHNSSVPRTFAGLEALPGVGHKTASVVMAQAFGHPALPVDTHVHRLAGRWGLSRGKTPVETERDLKRLYPEERWHPLHLQMIFFGRECCPARGHDLSQCPICSWAASKKRIREENGRR